MNYIRKIRKNNTQKKRIAKIKKYKRHLGRKTKNNKFKTQYHKYTRKYYGGVGAGIGAGGAVGLAGFKASAVHLTGGAITMSKAMFLKYAAEGQIFHTAKGVAFTLKEAVLGEAALTSSADMAVKMVVSAPVQPASSLSAAASAVGGISTAAIVGTIVVVVVIGATVYHVHCMTEEEKKEIEDEAARLNQMLAMYILSGVILDGIVHESEPLTWKGHTANIVLGTYDKAVGLFGKKSDTKYHREKSRVEFQEKTDLELLKTVFGDKDPTMLVQDVANNPELKIDLDEEEFVRYMNDRLGRFEELQVTALEIQSVSKQKKEAKDFERKVEEAEVAAAASVAAAKAIADAEEEKTLLEIEENIKRLEKEETKARKELQHLREAEIEAIAAIEAERLRKEEAERQEAAAAALERSKEEALERLRKKEERQAKIAVELQMQLDKSKQAIQQKQIQNEREHEEQKQKEVEAKKQFDKNQEEKREKERQIKLLQEEKEFEERRKAAAEDKKRRIAAAMQGDTAAHDLQQQQLRDERQRTTTEAYVLDQNRNSEANAKAATERQSSRNLEKESRMQETDRQLEEKIQEEKQKILQSLSDNAQRHRTTLQSEQDATLKAFELDTAGLSLEQKKKILIGMNADATSLSNSVRIEDISKTLDATEIENLHAKKAELERALSDFQRQEARANTANQQMEILKKLIIIESEELERQQIQAAKTAEVLEKFKTIRAKELREQALIYSRMNKRIDVEHEQLKAKILQIEQQTACFALTAILSGTVAVVDMGLSAYKLNEKLKQTYSSFGERIDLSVDKLTTSIDTLLVTFHREREERVQEEQRSHEVQTRKVRKIKDKGGGGGEKNDDEEKLRKFEEDDEEKLQKLEEDEPFVSTTAMTVRRILLNNLPLSRRDKLHKDERKDHNRRTELDERENRALENAKDLVLSIRSQQLKISELLKKYTETEEKAMYASFRGDNLPSASFSPPPRVHIIHGPLDNGGGGGAAVAAEEEEEEEKKNPTFSGRQQNKQRSTHNKQPNTSAEKQSGVVSVHVPIPQYVYNSVGNQGNQPEKVHR